MTNDTTTPGAGEEHERIRTTALAIMKRHKMANDPMIAILIADALAPGHEKPLVHGVDMDVPAAASAGLSVEDETVSYVLRYGGRCRACADEDGVCPSSGLPCEPEAARRAIRRVLEAVNYGQRHGYLTPPGDAGAAGGPKLRCKACNSPRAKAPCHKCGGPLFEAHPDWEDVATPDIDRIRELAREVGYAVGVHGSLERDLDLIAAPWVASAVSAPDLAAHIAKGMSGRVLDDAIQDKPHGRWACNIDVDGWFKLIDLSVMPPPAVGREPAAWRIRFRTKWAMHNWAYVDGKGRPDLEPWNGVRGHEFEPLYAAPPPPAKADAILALPASAGGA